MIKEINNAEDLNNVAGGVVIVRSGSFTSGSTSSRPVSRSSRFSDDAFAGFFARREAARARNAQREQERAAREESGSTRRGFPASAALGLP